ncbi:MAG TPA: class I SAM-dependent methyltransferase [Thermoplasmata archaeon]|nr:class I SAM-dependent methyltransferase [Thermoplasmata archaeon]
MSVPAPDAAEIRERERQTWSTAAAGWRTNDAALIQMFGPVTEEIVRRSGAGPGMRVLDLASGTGEPSLSLAAKVGAKGSVLGLDLAEPMLEVAREKARSQGVTNVEYRVTDIESAGLPADAFDAATMRWGIMFLPDPVAAMRVVHRALRPGACIVLSTWGAPAENPFLSIPLGVLRRYTEVPTPAPSAPGIFAFADPQRLSSTLTAAGFSGVETGRFPLRLAGFSSGRKYWEFIQGTAGPILRLYSGLPAEVRARVDADIQAEAEKFKGTDAIEFPALPWLGWGTK